MITMTTIFAVVDGQLQASTRRSGVPSHPMELMAAEVAQTAQKAALGCLADTLVQSGMAAQQIVPTGVEARKIHNALLEKQNAGGKN